MYRQVPKIGFALIYKTISVRSDGFDGAVRLGPDGENGSTDASDPTVRVHRSDRTGFEISILCFAGVSLNVSIDCLPDHS